MLLLTAPSSAAPRSLLTTLIVGVATSALVANPSLLHADTTAAEQFDRHEVKKDEILSEILFDKNLRPIWGNTGSLIKTLQLNPGLKEKSGDLIYPGTSVLLPVVIGVSSSNTPPATQTTSESAATPVQVADSKIVEEPEAKLDETKPHLDSNPRRLSLEVGAIGGYLRIDSDPPQYGVFAIASNLQPGGWALLKYGFEDESYVELEAQTLQGSFQSSATISEVSRASTSSMSAKYLVRRDSYDFGAAALYSSLPQTMINSSLVSNTQRDIPALGLVAKKSILTSTVGQGEVSASVWYSPDFLNGVWVQEGYGLESQAKYYFKTPFDSIGFISRLGYSVGKYEFDRTAQVNQILTFGIGIEINLDEIALEKK